MKELIAKLKAMLEWASLSDEQKAEIKAQIAAAEQLAAQPAPAPRKTEGDESPVVKELREVIAAMQEQNKQTLAALAEEKKAREDGLKALKEQQKAEREKKIAEFIEKNKTRIPPAEVEEYKKKLDADFDGYSKLIEKLPEDPAMKRTPADKKDQKPGDKSAPREGIMKSAPQDILNKVMEFGQVSEN